MVKKSLVTRFESPDLNDRDDSLRIIDNINQSQKFGS